MIYLQLFFTFLKVGAFAFGGADVQANLLSADGIEVIDNKVDLAKYGL